MQERHDDSDCTSERAIITAATLQKISVYIYGYFVTSFPTSRLFPFLLFRVPIKNFHVLSARGGVIPMLNALSVCGTLFLVVFC